MTKLALFLLAFVSITITTNSYKILGIFPSPDRNSYLTYRTLFRELASRNNEVTLISHFPMSDAPASYKDILLSDKQVRQSLSFESVIPSDESRVPFETLVATKAGNDDCQTLMNNNQVLHLILTRPQYDVILVESYNSDCGIALAANLSAPYIAFNPKPLQPWHYGRLGLNLDLGYSPQSNLPYGKDPWFLDRLRAYILHFISNLVYYVASQVTDHVYLYKYLGDNLPSLESLASRASLMFVNTHQSVFGGFSRPDNVIDIGGIHTRPPKNLPTEIERFINEAQYGVVYVNLGLTVDDSTFPAEKLTALLSTFRQLPHRILWKWDGGVIQNLPRNVMTMKWLPQYDILKHDNVKVFITNAGTLSTIEAIDAGIPVVAIPLFGDQYGNAAALQDAGMATIVNYYNLNKEQLLNAVNEVLDASKLQQAKLTSRLWHDRPLSPLESAIYWTEYVARYQGAPNLQSLEATAPFYKQYQLDVVLFLFIVILALIYALNKILVTICCCCCSKNVDVEDDSDQGTPQSQKTKRVKFE